MRLHRFYIQEPNLGEEVILNNTEILHQWIKVLRLAEGEHVILFDAMQIEAEYAIHDLGKHRAFLSRVRICDPKRTPNPSALAWALLKKDKNEWVVQKSVELGVTNLFPMISDRTEKTGFPMDRFEKIIIEAVEQSGRTDLPEIVAPKTIYTLVQELRDVWSIVALDQGGTPLSASKSKKPTLLFVGPEGGWTEREREMFRIEKIPVVSIGSFTLRAETAAIAGATLLTQTQ